MVWRGGGNVGILKGKGEGEGSGDGNSKGSCIRVCIGRDELCNDTDEGSEYSSYM